MLGLSPRVRGNQLQQQLSAVVDGSIPACAGEPSRRWSSCLKRKVYPRVCGGTPQCGFSSRQPAGSIPACAGEPLTGLLLSRRWRVYPRVCGGTRAAGRAQSVTMGLSPRVRGNQCRRATIIRRAGSIPACAGEPTRMLKGYPAGRVYPRVCGGTFRRSISIPVGQGLSPRVRGNPVDTDHELRMWRSIPACAGEPFPAAGRRLL